MPIEKSAYLNPVEPNMFGSGKQKPYQGKGAGPIEFKVENTRDSGNFINDGLPEDVEEPLGEHYENLVGFLDERITQRIGKQCKQWFDKDLESRSGWEDVINKGLENLGITIDDLDEPFEGACARYSSFDPRSTA